MLKPEVARQQLANLISKTHAAGRMARIEKLPKAQAEIAEGLFARFDGRPGNWQEQQRKLKKSVIELASNQSSRKRIFTAIFPTFHESIEAGWQLLTRLPYTIGYQRRSFRLPKRPEAYIGKYSTYIEEILDGLKNIADDALSPEWLAQWAVHLGRGRSSFGYLLAACIDAGGADSERVLEILKDSAANRHEIGGPGTHATRALLCCDRPAAWEFMESLLLAAQRQEGLRQSILEAVDEAHPKAFQRMVGVVLDNDLIRFASVARAAGVWVGETQVVEEPKRLKTLLQTIADLIGDEKKRREAIQADDAALAYRGLWAVAFHDAEEAIKRAKPLFSHADPAQRFAAAKLAIETSLPGIADLVLKLLHDSDQRLVSLALTYAMQIVRVPSYLDDDDDNPFKTTPPNNLFERLERIIPGLPEKSVELKPPVEGWFVADLAQANAADLLPYCLAKRNAEKLLPYLPMMNVFARIEALAKLCTPRTLTTKVRQTLLTIAGESNRYVREAAMKYLKLCTLAEDEVLTLERYLTRKTPDFRRSVFELLLNRKDSLVLGTVDRLLDAGDANCRTAGIEIARRLVDEERSAEVVREKLRDYRDHKGKRLATAEAEAIAIALDPALRPPTLDDGLGTFDPNERTPVVEPESRRVEFATNASVAFLKSLDAFIHEHRNTTFIIERSATKADEKVLGSIRYYWEFPGPASRNSRLTNEIKLPLSELWESWWNSRSDETRDADGLEFVRAFAMPLTSVREGEEANEIEADDENDADTAAAIAQVQPCGSVAVRYTAIIQPLLEWFLHLYPNERAADFALDAAESALALVPQALREKLPQTDLDEAEAALPANEKTETVEWRRNTPFVKWFEVVDKIESFKKLSAGQTARQFRLARWLDEPFQGARRNRPDLELLLAAYHSKSASLADFLDDVIGPRPWSYYSRGSFDSLRCLTMEGNRSYPTVQSTPELREAVDRVVTRIVEIELARGETPTAATAAAACVNRIHGLDRLFDLVAALGKNGFIKPPSYGTSENKPAVLTRLIQVSSPLPADTPDAFASAAKAAIKAGRFDLERIAELGLVNPRWVKHVAATIKWPGYEEAVYWFIAHTSSGWSGTLGSEAKPDDDDGEKQTKAENSWQTIVKARTNLTAEQLADGLIDVAWFHQAYAAVGSDKRWDAIESAAKFLGFGQSHKKAARLADVLLGRTKKKDLVSEIRVKTLKESVRLLGLLPLPKDSAKKDAELADRYKVLKEYERYAMGLSSLSKEPALQSARLGMENLAVTAGFADPIRLEWAVTAREVADLERGPAVLKVKDIDISLKLTDLAESEITQSRAGKPLKALPADVKKLPQVAEIFTRKKTLTRMAANTKRSLEQGLCAGDRFTPAELKMLMQHAIVRPFLERLVLKTDSAMGFPVKQGTALKTSTGKMIAIKAKDSWSIAHPLDFVAAKDWHEWQAGCLQSQLVQPFKQIFREVYVLSPAEKEDGDRSRRYSGQQVNENQAKALLAARGWSTREDLSKIYRDANLVVMLSLDQGFLTPGEAAAPMVGAVTFHRRGDWKRLALSAVPKIIFSEVMRDVDLVVSVAHVGGVDPEASQSTIAMRTDLVRETCKLLKVPNVTLDSRHALIKGEYGQYSVHLGSGVVHKLPGGSLCVVPVEAQHRGRLFLPFADDDPRTAEVVSKVLLLARDREIQDPTILEQIAAR